MCDFTLSSNEKSTLCDHTERYLKISLQCFRSGPVSRSLCSTNCSVGRRQRCVSCHERTSPGHDLGVMAMAPAASMVSKAQPSNRLNTSFSSWDFSESFDLPVPAKRAFAWMGQGTAVTNSGLSKPSLSKSLSGEGESPWHGDLGRVGWQGNLTCKHLKSFSWICALYQCCRPSFSWGLGILKHTICTWSVFPLKDHREGLLVIYGAHTGGKGSRSLSLEYSLPSGWAQCARRRKVGMQMCSAWFSAKTELVLNCLKADLLRHDLLQGRKGLMGALGVCFAEIMTTAETHGSCALGAWRFLFMGYWGLHSGT